MKTSEFLIKAKALIDSPEKWTTGQLAKNSDGWTVSPEDDDAVCFCSVGALERVYFLDLNSKYSDWDRSRIVLWNQIDHGFIPDFNDSHTHSEVMEMWDKAIAQAISDENAAIS